MFRWCTMLATAPAWTICTCNHWQQHSALRSSLQNYYNTWYIYLFLGSSVLGFSFTLKPKLKSFLFLYFCLTHIGCCVRNGTCMLVLISAFTISQQNRWSCWMVWLWGSHFCPMHQNLSSTVLWNKMHALAHHHTKWTLIGFSNSKHLSRQLSFNA